MSEMINFGIDLGTTNSLVAKFNTGIVEVFKNPSGFKESLPSVVGFRNDRILIGEQARRYVERDSKNVVSQFKRKMGTTESFKIKALDQSKTPIELSTFVLKELKTFIHTGEVPEAIVITIPASFDMVQCNATKEAGLAAGFKQVILLNEPIAASLAYANKEKNVDLKNSQWIVYDLGGGTFDVALVKIMEGELKIVDHEGNNYLGGADFDALIVEKIIVPQLEKRGKFTDLLKQMKSESGKYNRLWYSLLHKAEEAKIELSNSSSAEIDLNRISIEDEDGKAIDDEIQITRSEYETLIKDAIDNTAEMMRKILTRNSLRPQDLKFVLMVGGSTYTPIVRKRIEELLGIPVNTGIDPTNAIVIGAAYFAATREINLVEKSAEKSDKQDELKVRVSYNRASKEREEIFAARIVGDIDGLFYRITCDDGSYDSGLKKLSSRINEDLPLQEDAYNLFSFKIYDVQNNPIPADFDSIQIAQGIYNPAGQMLPEDLSLVKDDPNTGDTKLDLIFAKNTVLPTRVKKTVEVSKAVMHGSSDEIRIIVVEGPSENHSTVNKPVGLLEIKGKSLKRDLLRGMEIDLTFELSESRDLTIQAYVNPSGPEFSQIYSPTRRDVPVDMLTEEILMLGTKLEQEKAEALSNENYEVVEKLDKLCGPVEKLHDEAMIMSLDDVTDDRRKLEDKKRKFAQEIFQLTAGKRLERLRAEYQAAKEEVTEIVNEGGNDHERRQLHEIVTREHTFLNSKNPQKLELEIDQLHHISFQILRRTPDFLISWFQHLVQRRETFNDQLQAKNLIEAGKKHIESDDYDKLAEVNARLHNLLPHIDQVSKEMWHYTRII
ncbi:MAG: Hsp70 family protein [Sedimentisphaerales bacterium]|nr:Hsp70 family protein [Sedimentisphaerales bacterium]